MRGTPTPAQTWRSFTLHPSAFELQQTEHWSREAADKIDFHMLQAF
jgi:hypothetical protein